jgi:hypothetical protein
MSYGHVRAMIAFPDGRLEHYETELDAKRAADRHNAIYGPNQAYVYVVRGNLILQIAD